MKRLVRGGFLFLFLFLCSMQTAAAASIRIFLDDKAVSFAEAPFIENDRVLVPMRGILESLGYSVACILTKKQPPSTAKRFLLMLRQKSGTGAPSYRFAS